ncbi:MAG: hypothetical protein AAFO07_31510, partial [Bacteroidota bacterium]
MIEAIRNNKYLFVPLILSLLFFLRKGIQYAIIGSYIPLLISVLVLLPMSLTIWNRKKLFLLLSKVWAIIIILWSIVRLFISVVNFATNTFDE